MKELSIEEKAKRYDEAMNELRDLHDNYNEISRLVDFKQELERIFPELKESEDERIVKELLTFFRESIHGGHILTNKEYDSWIAWLEKQVEQKPAWSEDDEMFVHGLIRGLIAKRDIHGHTTFSSDCIDITETINWLKSIKDRVLPQPKQEWSEEDERMYRGLHNLIYSTPYCDSRKELSDLLKSLKERVQSKQEQEWGKEDEKCIRLSTDIIDSALRAGFCVQLDRDRCVDWLKSLRPQSQWKPSEEQMAVLNEVINYAANSELQHWSSFIYTILKSLREQLKKLKG